MVGNITNSNRRLWISYILDTKKAHKIIFLGLVSRIDMKSEGKWQRRGTRELEHCRALPPPPFPSPIPLLSYYITRPISPRPPLPPLSHLPPLSTQLSLPPSPSSHYFTLFSPSSHPSMILVGFVFIAALPLPSPPPLDRTWEYRRFTTISRDRSDLKRSKRNQRVSLLLQKILFQMLWTWTWGGSF